MLALVGVGEGVSWEGWGGRVVVVKLVWAGLGLISTGFQLTE